MFCTNCGKQTGENDNFCRECGFQTKAGASAPHASAFGYQAPRRLYRLTQDKKIAGVCSGLAQYFDVDVTLMRLAVAAGIIFSGGLGLVAYIAAWVIMPTDRRVMPMHPAAGPAQTAV